MAIIKSSTPYAKALFDLAKETNSLEGIKADVVLIKSVLTQSAEFRDFISNPTFQAEKTFGLIDKVFSGKINSNTLNFLKVLVSKNRIAQLDSVCDSFNQLYNQSLNLSDVKLTTAVAVSDEMKHQIATNVVKNSNSQIENIVDPSILGGFIVEFDNKILDQSVLSKLNKIKNKFV